MKKTHWSEAEDRVLRAARAEGLTLLQIAITLGRPPNAVAIHSYRTGIAFEVPLTRGRPPKAQRVVVPRKQRRGVCTDDCAVSGCPRRVVSRGLCHPHRERETRGTSLTHPPIPVIDCAECGAPAWAREKHGDDWLCRRCWHELSTPAPRRSASSNDNANPMEKAS
jgi:hypothetical protein